MPVFWRMVLSIYNLILLVVGAAAVAISLGAPEPLQYINLVAATPENRIICGTVGILLFFLALVLLYLGLRNEPNGDGILVDKGVLGEVSISIEAVKLIIMKAVRQIDGVKEIRPVVRKGPAGLLITLKTMINPALSAPELSSALQKTVKEHLENIGGLPVAEIKVEFHDFNADK